MRFTDWIFLDEIEESVPIDPGLFQIKIREGLLAYPTGKSAMFYYGYSEDLNYGLVKFRQEILPQLKMQQDILLARWMETENFESQIQRYLHFFQSNFGSLPLGNEMLLQQNNESVNRGN